MTDSIDATVIDALADDPRVIRALRTMRSRTARGMYTASNLPPDCGYKRFLELVRLIPGARKVGRKWQVPIAEWEKARTTAEGPR